jgi:hypothetical protein
MDFQMARHASLFRVAFADGRLFSLYGEYITRDSGALLLSIFQCAANRLLTLA